MGDSTHADEHGVDPRPLESEHLVAVLDVDPRDRELSGGDIGEQVEHGIERVVVTVTVDSGEQEDLGIALLQRELELLLVADVRDRLEVVVHVVVLGPERHGVDVGRVTRSDPEEGQVGRRTDAVDRPRDRERFGALLLGVSCAARVLDAGDDRNPVTFGDALAEAA